MIALRICASVFQTQCSLTSHLETVFHVMASLRIRWTHAVVMLGATGTLGGGGCDCPEYAISDRPLQGDQDSASGTSKSDLLNGISAVGGATESSLPRNLSAAGGLSQSSFPSWTAWAGDATESSVPPNSSTAGGATESSEQRVPSVTGGATASSDSPNPSPVGGSIGTTSLGGSQQGMAGAEFGTTSSGGSPASRSTRCQRDQDCAKTSALKVCEPVSALCVECVAGTTTCPAGQYCGSDMECHIGCAANVECATGMCDASRNRCVGCSKNVECSLGTTCDVLLGACVESCGVLVSCPSGWSCCGGSCVNLRLDEDNCGRCGAACGHPNAALSCVDSVCVIEECRAGYADCNGNPQDGCEVALLTDVRDCGACGLSCDLPYALSGCAQGRCTVRQCAAGRADCNASAEDGCEVDILTDPAHCGDCGTACSAAKGAASCKMGNCGVTPSLQ
jgi:hypothetical protein